MAAELGLNISLTQLQKLVQSQQNLPPPNSMSAAATWMFMNNQTNHFPLTIQNDANQEQEEEEEDEESNWEVKAFEEDTNNVMGTTWPPRSYTCTFCRREFRSAQALGGHMNVHRRDRARLHHPHPHPQPYPPPVIIPSTQDFIPNAGGGGLCLVYSLPQNPNSNIGGTPSKLISDSRSSVSYINFPVAVGNNYDGYNPNPNPSPNHGSITYNGGSEEIDLELRLGRRSWSSS